MMERQILMALKEQNRLLRELIEEVRNTKQSDVVSGIENGVSIAIQRAIHDTDEEV